MSLNSRSGDDFRTPLAVHQRDGLADIDDSPINRKRFFNATTNYFGLHAVSSSNCRVIHQSSKPFPAWTSTPSKTAAGFSQRAAASDSLRSAGTSRDVSSGSRNSFDLSLHPMETIAGRPLLLIAEGADGQFAIMKSL